MFIYILVIDCIANRGELSYTRPAGTQVMLLVASETGHVYTFATPKLQPMITSEAGKTLIQTCLNSPDQPGLATNTVLFCWITEYGFASH